MLAEIADAGKITDMLLDVARTLTGRAESKPAKKLSILAPFTTLLARKKAS
jgi:hypothetical protein